MSLSPHAHALQKRNRASVLVVGHGGQSILFEVVEHILEPAQNSIGRIPVPLMFAREREAQVDLPRFVGQSQHAEVANHLPRGFNLYSVMEPLALHIRVYGVNAAYKPFCIGTRVILPVLIVGHIRVAEISQERSQVGISESPSNETLRFYSRELRILSRVLHHL